MKTWKSRPILVIIGVLLLALIGCSGDSPTEPSKPGSGNPIPPSDSVTITVSVSNLTRTSATVTATIDGGAAADGTAVEFETSVGTFLETGTAYALRSTVGGKASVTVLAVEGENKTTVRVRAKSTVVDRDVVFGEEITGAPTISSITPAKGSPVGGYIVSIRGRSFVEPLRVFFGVKEAVIASFTPETETTTAEIKAVVPSVDLGPSTQFEEVAVTVVAHAGTVDEISGSTATPDGDPLTNDGFRYELDIQTPLVYDVSPSSGPNEGNTRITIIGEGFQSPLKAWFGSGNTRVDLELVSVSYGQIIAVTPPAAGLGSSFLNSSVNLTVQNVASNTMGTLSNAFRYGPEMQITGVSPTQGSILGGTRVTINGWGFDDPVAVTLAETPAQVIRVSGTEIVVIASAPVLNGCPSGGISGAVTVKNIEDNADAVEGPDFTYTFNPPVITFFSPASVQEGFPLSVTVANPGLGNVQFTLSDDGQDRTIFPTPNTSAVATGNEVFTFSVPTGLTFETIECTTGGGGVGVRNAPTNFPLTFKNLTIGCTTDPIEVTVEPDPLNNPCVADPVASIAPDPVAFGARTEGLGPYVLQVSISNFGGSDLIISNVLLDDLGAGVFTKGPLSSTVVTPGGAPATFDVTFNPPVTGVATPYTGTLTFSTNDPGSPTVVNVSGTGTP